MYKYITILYTFDKNVTQNENDSINSILQYDRVVDNNCCVVFPTRIFIFYPVFQIVQIGGSYHLLSYKD